MLLTESKVTTVLTEGLRYHLETGTPLYENIYRPGSEEYFNTIRQARLLMNEGVLQGLCFEDIELLFETEVGEYAEFEGQRVPLDFPMIEEISFVIPDGEATWREASSNPQVMKMGEEQWKKLSDLSKATGGLGYTAKYSDIDPVLEDPTGDTNVTFSDNDQIQMPVVLKYDEAGQVKYEIVVGEDVLASLISSGTDEDPDIWVVDITQESQQVQEADMTFPQKLAIIKKIVAIAKKSGTHLTDDQLAALIAKQITFDTGVKLKPGEFKVIKEAVAEAKYQGKEVTLNKPKRGGIKKFYVYTRNPKTGKIKKVSFGDTTGLSAKINNKTARVAFAKRHNCATKKDKTKAGYWSCRLPRYAKLLGLKSSFGGYW